MRGEDMKLDRMIGILAVLLQKERVTAPELAAKFEVSRRTISRDIDALCRAGIPIDTRQGAGGGIAIMDGYRIDRALLTGADMRAILAGLRSLDSVSGTNRYAALMEKLSAGASDVIAADDCLLIDLASWYRGPLSEKIGLIHAAIDDSRAVGFRYYSPSGESDRQVEPYFLVFHWSSWYLWGWCRAREDWRLFKLNRMTALQRLDAFQRRPAQMPDLSDARVLPGRLRIKTVVQPQYRWRLIEEYGPESFEELADGTLSFERDFNDRDGVVTWLLSFGRGAELLEPVELRKELAGMGEWLSRTYGERRKDE